MANASQFEIQRLKSHPKVRALVRDLSSPNELTQIRALALDWLIMGLAAYVCSVCLASNLGTPLKILVYVASCILIACRQHALLVLMHEGAHFRLLRSQRMNDFVCELFAAYPTLSSLVWYRRHHTLHHRATNTDADPDWVRKLPLAEWQYPQSKLQIARTIGKQMVRGGWDWLVFMTSISRGDLRRTIYWATVFLVAFVIGYLTELMMYWMVPLLSAFPVVQRIRSISEHFGLPNEHEFNGTRNVLANPVERFFLSPHNVNYHLAHHLFPSVPFHALPELHSALMQHECYARLSHNNSSYLFGSNSVFSDLQNFGSHPRTDQKLNAA